MFKNGLVNNTRQNLFARRDTSLDEINASLEAASVELDIPYFDKLKHACDRTKSECDVVDDNGEVLYLDYGHWSYEGAEYLGEKLLSDPAFKELLYSGDSEKFLQSCLNILTISGPRGVGNLNGDGLPNLLWTTRAGTPSVPGRARNLQGKDPEGLLVRRGPDSTLLNRFKPMPISSCLMRYLARP